LSRIADRRWDLIYRNGMRVQLPEMGVAQAFAALDDYQKQYALLDRDLSLIDLRVSGTLVVRLVNAGQEDVE
jgi:cell division protein FtsQ